MPPHIKITTLLHPSTLSWSCRATFKSFYDCDRWYRGTRRYQVTAKLWSGLKTLHWSRRICRYTDGVLAFPQLGVISLHIVKEVSDFIDEQMKWLNPRVARVGRDPHLLYDNTPLLASDWIFCHCQDPSCCGSHIDRVYNIGLLELTYLDIEQGPPGLTKIHPSFDKAILFSLERPTPQLPISVAIQMRLLKLIYHGLYSLPRSTANLEAT